MRRAGARRAVVAVVAGRVVVAGLSWGLAMVVQPWVLAIRVGN